MVAGNPRIDELRKKLDKEPGSRLFAQLAEELRKDGDLEDAIRVAREGLQKHSNYPSARMTLGRALYDTGDWAAARAEFELVLKGAPDNILASRLLAESLEGLGDVPAAIARYKQTLALAPGDKQVLGRLEALEAAGGAAPVAGVAPSTAAAAPSPAPIRVAEVDTPMELEQAHERATVFSAGPAAPPPVPPATASAAPVEPPAAPPTAVSPPPIPVSTADEEFELERPYEAPRAEPPPAPVPPPRPSAPAPPPRAAEAMMEFEFDAGPVGSTIPFAPPPAPAPATAPPPPLPPPQEAEPTVPAIVIPPPTPEPGPEPAPPPAPEPAATPPAVAIPAPKRVEAPPPAAPPADAVPVPAPAAASPSDELTSATLAELYFKQGFTEKAVEVYRQLIQRDPENDRLHRRLAEIQHARPATAAPTDVAVPASEPAAVAAAAPGPDPASRRLALERTIAKLEGMLSAIKKG
jgi:tetratricopeptide (TPR) repeat protein